MFDHFSKAIRGVWVADRRFSFAALTDRGRRVLVLAREEALLLGHRFIGTEHILLGLIEEKGMAAKALESLGISFDAARAKIEETIGPAGPGPDWMNEPPFTPRAKKVLELSGREARRSGNNDIGPEHMLLGLVDEGEGVAVQVLVGLGVDLSRVRQQVIAILSGDQPTEPRRGPKQAIGRSAFQPPGGAALWCLSGELDGLAHLPDRGRPTRWGWALSNGRA